MLVGCAAVLRAAQRSVTSVSTAVPISILFGCRNSWAKEWKTQAGDHRGGTRRARAHAPYWSPTGRHGGAPIPTPTAESLAAECWLRAVALTKVKAFRWFGWQRSMPLVFSKSRSRPHPLSLTPPRSGPPLAITTFHY